jgi:hypothetical protein
VDFDLLPGDRFRSKPLDYVAHHEHEKIRAFDQDQRDGPVKLPFFIYLPLPWLERPDERQIEPTEEPQP